MIPVQQQTFTIPGNGSFPLQCSGRYFRIQSATGALKVVGDTFGPMGSVSVGQGLHLREQDQPFQRLTFVDTSGVNNIVTVVVADADFVDNSLLGTVSVIDGGLSRTKANASFASAVGVTTTVAANQCALQLFNNAAAGGKLVVVEQVTMFTNYSAVAQMFYTMRVDGTAITALVSAAVAKLQAGADSAIAQLRSAEGAAWTGKTVGFGSSSAIFQPFTFTPKEPIVLPPQSGLSIVTSFPGAAAIHSLWASFEHYEQAP